MSDGETRPRRLFARLITFSMYTLTTVPISNRLILGAVAAILPLMARAQSSKPMMKAIVAHEYGGPQVLKYEDAPRPEPKENEALVRVIAAGVNPVDALIRTGKYAKFFGTTLPLIPGYDIAGIVEKTGAKITK